MSRKKSTYPGIRYRSHETRVFKRQKDKYFSIRYYRDGKEIEEGVGWLSDGMSAMEASEIRTALIKNIRLGKYPQSVEETREIERQRRKEEQKKEDRARLQNITFDEVAKEFLIWSEANKKSYISDQSRYDHHLKKRFGKIRMKDISSFPHLENLKRDLQKQGKADATIFQVLQLVRAIYHKSVEWNLYQGTIPTSKTKLFPKINNQRTGFLTREQAIELLDRIKQKSFKVWCQCILALHAGLRFGEIASLEWIDIKFDAGLISIRNPKSGIDRSANLNDPIRAMIEDLIEDRKKRGIELKGLMFPNTKGGKQDHISRTFYGVVKKMGLNNGIEDPKEKISFHSLRHTYGSHLSMQGYPIKMIQELMGHKTLEMTARYSHFSPGLKQDAAKRLGDLFSEDVKDNDD